LPFTTAVSRPRREESRSEAIQFESSMPAALPNDRMSFSSWACCSAISSFDLAFIVSSVCASMESGLARIRCISASVAPSAPLPSPTICR
jgi:hypothetical protein